MPASGARRRLVAGDAVDGAGGKANADVVLRHTDRAIVLEALDAAGVVAVIMRGDDVFHRQRRDGRDRRLDLVVERRVLAVDDDDAVGADRDGDVAARAFQPKVLLPRSMVLMLDLGEVDRLLRKCTACERDRRGRDDALRTFS